MFMLNWYEKRFDVIFKSKKIQMIVFKVLFVILTCCLASVPQKAVHAQLGGVNFQDIGPSPIFGPVRAGDWQSVDYLLKSGVSPNVKESEEGQSPLVLATIGRHLDIVETLLQFEARIDVPDNFGRTALSWAAVKGEYEIAKILLVAKANLNHQNNEGLTPLMQAVKNSQIELVQLLLQWKPDFSIRDYTGRGPMDWARAQRNPQIELMLRQAGAPG
ncbi:MAG: hypothetical protein CMM76_02260 [Rhodospirillaceae bacterium]|nr:hypothetical protein [Rhodospirillaceae bacterium]|tara:strand:- start:35 stop:685 length:651 start_codon:yes stop_codon:yes gene_type:complete